MGKILLADGLEQARALAGGLRTIAGVGRVEPTGAIRRAEMILEEITLLVELATGRAAPIRTDLERFCRSLPGVNRVAADAEGDLCLELSCGVPARLVFAPAREYPFQLLSTTGPPAHLRRLERYAASIGRTLNPPGMKGVESEVDLYRRLALAPVPPEMRGDGGEIETASSGGFSHLIRREDLRGTFHVHTLWSDGAATLPEMAAAADRIGLQYLGISDHSRAARIANGMSIERLLDQMEEIDEWNRSGRKPYLLKGSEVDILEDGSLDFPDEILARLDFVIGSVHAGFDIDRGAMTRRVLRAMENRYLTILGHPTGRLMLASEPFAIDMKEVVRAAARRGVVIELNANPRRMDVEPAIARYAAELGVLLAIDPDAHTPDAIADCDQGVVQARKGWIRPENVLNCLPVEQVLEFRRGSRTGIADAGRPAPPSG